MVRKGDQQEEASGDGLVRGNGRPMEMKKGKFKSCKDNEDNTSKGD